MHVARNQAIPHQKMLHSAQRLNSRTMAAPQDSFGRFLRPPSGKATMVHLKSLNELTPKRLKEDGVKALLLDWDQTMAPSKTTDVPRDRYEWLSSILDEEIPVMILSNDFTWNWRVATFCSYRKIPYVFNAKKPLYHPEIDKFIEKHQLATGELAIVDENPLLATPLAKILRGHHYIPPQVVAGKDSKEPWLLSHKTRGAGLLICHSIAGLKTAKHAILG